MMVVLAAFIFVQRLRISLDWVIPFFLMSEIASLKSIFWTRKRMNRVASVDSRGAASSGSNRTTESPRQIRVRVICKFLSVVGYFAFGAVSSLAIYQWVVFLPVAIYYTIRVVQILVRATYEYVYQVFVVIYLLTLLLFVV